MEPVSPGGRRHFLLGALAAGLAGLVPAVLRDALAVSPHHATGTIKDVEHVVILMQENRSFDHYFGTLAGVRGFGDRFTIPLPDGRSVWEQSNGRRIVMPYHLDQSAGNAQCRLDLPHSWHDAHEAWSQGRMHFWPTVKTDASMAYYTQRELPFQYALAQAFTLCDAYHCSLQGGTNPNRLFMLTGTNDPGGKYGGPSIVNQQEGLGPVSEGVSWVTYAERLEQAGVSWKVYQDMDDNYDCNMLTIFRQFREAHLNRPNALADKGLTSTLRDANVEGLRDDVLAGRLPQVSWIFSPRLYCEHPGPSTPAQGGAYTQQVLEALLANPEVWSKTVFLQMYDENDAFFDHMPPPAPPSLQRNGVRAGLSTVDFSQDCHSDGHVYGLGPRVPMHVISPWSKGGWVNSQVFDHTSIIRFLEQRFGVAEPQISPWRRAVCGDLTSCFDFGSRDASVPRFAPRGRSWADAQRLSQRALAGIEIPAERAQRLPRQEAGVRPSRPLPYRLAVRDRVERTAQGQALRLDFVNTGEVGAVFHVYDQLQLKKMPRRYTVEGGKQLSDLWTPAPAAGGGGGGEAVAAQPYDLWVLGPNGFHRRLRGRFGTDAPALSVDAEARGATLLLTLRNGGPDCTLNVAPGVYGTPAARQLHLAANAELALPLECADQHNWYDFTLHCGPWSRRFAGRLETGHDSVSDPAMARE